MTLPSKTLTPRQNQLIAESLLIEEEDARAAGTLGFMAQTMAQITLPHTKQDTLYYKRTNGKLILSVRGHESYGVPFGTVPRILLAWICTEAVKTKDCTLVLGRSISEFINKLEMHPNGRDIARLKNQCLALARSVISIDSQDNSSLAFEDIKIAARGFIFWSDKSPSQQGIWASTLTLTEEFYQHIVKSPVPFDMRVYQCLSKSPLAMDIYIWLVYRLFTLRVSGRKQALIPWISLKAQFGAGYSNDQRGLRNFKINFKKRLTEVLVFYWEARNGIEEMDEYLKLEPVPLHIKQHNKPRILA